MKSRTVRYLLIALLVVAGIAFGGSVSLHAVLPALGQTAEGGDGQREQADPLAAARKELAAREAQVIQRESRAAELEAALAGRVRELDAAQKSVAEAKKAEQLLQNERAKKTLKVYRALRPEEAAKLLDKMDEKSALDILNALDQKTIVKLIPHLNQPRVLKWTKETLAGG
jgi:flagellar motility protein MotE (MotC chaperone)